MTEEHRKLRQEHADAHRETLQVLYETDQLLKNVQNVITESRLRLLRATEKYEERLHGPTSS